MSFARKHFLSATAISRRRLQRWRPQRERHSAITGVSISSCSSSRAVVGSQVGIQQRGNALATGYVYGAGGRHVLDRVCGVIKLGEKGRRIRELTAVVQKRYGFPENSVELFAERVENRAACAMAQCESLRYKLLGGLAVRRACYGDREPGEWRPSDLSD